MADIALTTADKISVGTLTVQQHTFVASSAITAGAPVYLVAATGRVAPADANGSAPLNTCTGIATRTVAAGEGVTVVRRGILDGFDLSGLNFGDAVYVSDTVGRLADAAGTTSIKVGQVWPANGTELGTTADKVLLVEVTSDAG